MREMIQVEVANLEGAALEWAVAKCEGWTPKYPMEILVPQYSTD